MGPASSETMATCHVVAMPYPGRGHINPMMNLCKILASRSNRIQVTFVVTEEWLGFIGSEPKPASIRFGTIPNVLPSELVRAADMMGFIEATMTRMEEPFERLLDRLEPPVDIVIADTFMAWAVDVGVRRKIPVASFWPMAAAVFSILYHFDLLVQHGHFPVELPERGDERVDYIPGISPIRLADLPAILHITDPNLKQLLYRILNMVSKTTNAQYLLCTSSSELESPVIQALKAEFPLPIYSFGPLIPYFNLQRRSSIQNEPDYLRWLDMQPESSVLYVSMGSFLSVSSVQMAEIVSGLGDSGVRYLLVARDQAPRLQEGCGDSGMVVPWCDQLRVLCHSSVGGFWSHCGWNSTMEGLYAGVPLLAFPLGMDQFHNSKYVVEDRKVGWKVKGERERESLVRREEIVDLVKKFMDLDNDERKEMVKRAREIQETCRRAIEKGGSSQINVDAFIMDITN